jgi:hypothetical protein
VAHVVRHTRPPVVGWGQPHLALLGRVATKIATKAASSADGSAEPLWQLVEQILLVSAHPRHVAVRLQPSVDGARFLSDRGSSPVVCNLVVHHSAITLEAGERGIHLAARRWTRAALTRAGL